MTTRDCDCDHPFPFCVCAIGYTGETLAYHSRVTSSVIGWPTQNYDPDALAEHNERMRSAREQRQAIEAQARRAAKPKMALGVDQRTMPLIDCVPCSKRQETI